MDEHHTAHNDMVPSTTETIEYIKFAGVLVSITVIATLLYIAGGDAGISSLLRWFMGVFMLVFAGFKFVGYSMFAIMFRGYDVVAKRFAWYGYTYPFLQLGLAILYLADVLPVFRDAAVLLIAGVASIGVFKEVFVNKSPIKCACLGNIIKLPLSNVSFFEDAGMVIMAGTMLVLRIVS